MNKYRKFKIGHKEKVVKKKKVSASAALPPASTDSQSLSIQAPAPRVFSEKDKEVMAKIDELHEFMTQRGIPYICVSKAPDSSFPVARFSFNHEHNKPEQTHKNAEWIFLHLGDLVRRATNGIVSLNRTY